MFTTTIDIEKCIANIVNIKINRGAVFSIKNLTEDQIKVLVNDAKNKILDYENKLK